MTSYTDVVKGQAFKHLDTTKSIAIRFVDQNGNYAYPNSDHKWTAKIAIESGQKPGYIGDYPTYPDSGSLIVQSKDLVKLAPGEYRLEAWETYTDSDGNEDTAIWPTPASSISFTIEPNITDQTGEMVNQITFQDVVDSAVIAAGTNIVIAGTQTLPAGSQAKVEQKLVDGKNQFTFYLPAGATGPQGSRGYSFWAMKMTAGGNVSGRNITDLYNASATNLPAVNDLVVQPDGNVYQVTGVSNTDDGSNGGGTFNLGSALFSIKGADGVSPSEDDILAKTKQYVDDDILNGKW